MNISTRLPSVLLVYGLVVIDYAYSACRDDITSSTPDSRFTINSNGTVIDIQTGLMWMRCSLGQIWDGTTCTGDAATYTWQEALVIANGNSFADFTDWYLPNVKELNSIVETACYNSAINQTVFPNTPSSNYWSNSPKVNNYGYAWYVSFNYGGDNAYYKHYGLHVRLVRAAR
ncbi:DUF1566 domain-containing protein [Pseudoalteromonas rubra]|uniref:Lcl C-terminal domain-containing protein n=1 Tax=Pseudoalteromonas rubra TaxID=43658 RepID=UPI000F776E49|nr:DUF1566 domain-containing protein [Pseudoalteromonas rubra]